MGSEERVIGPPRRPFTVLRNLAARAEVDPAVFYVVLTRGWQLVAWPLTLYLMTRFFTAEVQGFYYTFSSLVALQSFVELGFYIVIINVASHEWARLRLDDDNFVRGDPAALSRLVSLGRMIFKWYAAASGVFVITVGVAGHVFFSRHPNPSVDWVAPWWTLIILSGLQLWAMAFNALLEGCNQVAAINQLRLGQAIIGSLAIWATLWAGGGLWAAAASVAVILLRDAYLLAIRYRRFFVPFLAPPATERIAWRTELWPLQWRLALQGVVNYFMFSLFTPVLFKYHGAVAAGQIGMTWQIVAVIQGFAVSWVGTRVPMFGMLIARKDFGGLDNAWTRITIVSTGVMAFGNAAFFVVVMALNLFNADLASRLLPPGPTALLLVASTCMQVVQCQAIYLRAHKKEPLVVTGVVSGLVIGLLVWLLGARYGAWGATAAYCAVTVLFTTPAVTMVWRSRRREWHAAETSPATTGSV